MPQTWVLAYQPTAPARVTVPYSYFLSQVQSSNVASVTAQGTVIQGTLRHAIKYGAQNRTTATLFKTNRPAFADDHLLSELLRSGAVVNAKPVQTGQSPWLTILGGVLPTVLLVGFWLWMQFAGQMGPGDG